jgi:hypothetical protein
MRRRFWVALALTGAVACGDLFAPPLKQATLNLAPDLREFGLLQGGADELRIRIFRGENDVFEDTAKVDTTLTVTGDSVVATLSLAITKSPQQVLILFEAIRSSDNVVLFSSTDTTEVEEESGEPEAFVPQNLQYVGPQAVSIAIAPRDTAVEAGTSFSFRATALDAAGGQVPVRFGLVSLADTVAIRVDRLTGQATTVTGAEATVHVFARTADSALADTTRVLIGAVPVGVAVDPGYANVGIESTTQFTGAVVDALGNAITIFPVNWTSRSTGVATVDETGLATGVAAGTAVLVADAPDFSGPAFTDSVLVTVPPGGNVVVSTTSNVRAFRRAQVGDTVVVDVTVDMTFTPDELLGSYNATLTWDPAVLSFVDVQAGDFPAPQVNDANAGSGELRFAQANADGASGVVVVARVRFEAVAAGSTSTAASISEMSAAVTFTDLIGRLTVTNGTVTVQ